MPTSPDMLGPFYIAGAPMRTSVGEGYALSGVVRSAADCSAISSAVLEFWMAGPDGEYADDYRATMLAGSDGSYQFTSHMAAPYGGRPPHIHVRVTAPGFGELVTQHYPVAGETQARFEIVLIPQ
jgi:protocatechuate 3,4-dioxygenase beta subunit